MLAPRAANARTVARPTPADAPVMTTTLMISPSMNRQQTRERVAQSFRWLRGQRPRRGLPHDVQRPPLLENAIRSVSVFPAAEADRHARFPDAQIAQRHFRKPLGQMR